MPSMVVVRLGTHEIRSVLYGLAIIAFLRFDPRGLRGIWHDARHAWVFWPLRY